MSTLSSISGEHYDSESYESLMAEKEHLDAAIANMLNKIQEYREQSAEWSEMDKVNARISEMRDKIIRLLNDEESEGLDSEKVTSIQNDIKAARNYKLILIKTLEYKASLTGENNYLAFYRKELARVTHKLWAEFGIEVN
jgi:Na+/phosphate symporter